MHVVSTNLKRTILAVGLTAALLVSGCSGSSGEQTSGPTTSFPYLVDPVDPGTGFVRLGSNRYPFDGVICTEGPADNDPEGSTRIFGVYANFEVDGSLAAIALTRYRNEVHGRLDTVPTITETALVQMQGDGEVRGLSAKRFQVEGATRWQDPADPTATTPLIVRDGDRYRAAGRFGALNGDATEPTDPDAGPDPGGSSGASGTDGEIVARCPAVTRGDDGAVTTSSSPASSPTGD